MHEPGQLSPDDETADVELWQRWRLTERPDVGAFLARFPDLGGTEVVAVLLVDQRERWQVGERVPAESYLRRFPALEGDPESVVELAYGEYLLREECGERPRLDEYLWRFPGHQDRLRLQVECHQALRQDGTTPSLASAQATLPRAPGQARGTPLVPGYEVLEELGRGGMGVVYKARQLKAGRVVALKMVLAGGHASTAEMERFRREAEAIARLQHPNIVQVFEVGEHQGLPFFSLEFCPGGSLDRKLAGKPLPAPQAAALLERLALAMQAAHERSIVHRDLKPANVLLAEDGTPRISDFGLARKLDEAGQTQTGSLLGTPSYMAPEQASGRSHEVEPSADVYALGAILYECLAGRPPFKAATYAETIRQVLEQEPVPPRRFNAAVPRDLETICLTCLHKDRGKRYASAATLADDLRRFLEDRPVAARRVARFERTWRWCRRNPVVATLSAGLLLLLTAAAVGGAIMSFRLNNALGQSQKAELEGKRKLFESYVAAADAKRMSGRPGQRFVTLQRIRDALKVGQEIGLDEADRLRLRNIAIAALCLPDIEPGLEWPAGPDRPLPDGLDPLIRRSVQARYACEGLPPPAHWIEEQIECPCSADGRFLAVKSGLWDPKTDIIPRRLWRIDRARPELLVDLPAEWVFWDNVAFRPDNRQVAFAHGDGSVSLYDLPTGKLVRRLKVVPGLAHCLGYHPQLPRLVAASAAGDGTEVAIWDVEKGQRLQQLTHPAAVTVVAWHPRGHRVAVGCSNGEIHLWDAETGQKVTAPWRGPPARDATGIRLAFNHAGDRVVSNNWDHVLRLWDAGTGKLLLSKSGRGTLGFASDDQSFGLDRDGDKFRLLRVAGGQELRSLHRPTPQGPQRFRGFGLHPNGRLLAATTRAGLVFFDLLHGEEIGFVPGTFSRWTRFDSTGALWTAGSAGLLRWPVEPGAAAPERFRIGPPEWVADVLRNGWDGFSVSDDGRVAVVPRHNSGALLVQRGPPRRTVPLGPQYDVWHVYVSPDGRWVVSGRHRAQSAGVRWKVWDAGTGKLVANLPWDEVNECLGFSPDSRWLYISGRPDRRLEVASLLARDVQPPVADDEVSVPPWQQAWRSEPMHLGGVFSPDNRLRARGSEDGTIRLVAPDTDEELARFPSPEVGRISPHGFSPDGRFLLTQGEETDLHVFDLRRIREQLAELGLDWAPPARAEQTNPALAPPLQVERIDAGGPAVPPG
jgi:serine/threonine-protein kinase